MAYYLEHSWRSVIQEPDTDDELEDYHDLNPFWKLQLARNTTRDAPGGRPFKLVCAFVSSVDIFRETMRR